MSCRNSLVGSKSSVSARLTVASGIPGVARENAQPMKTEPYALYGWILEILYCNPKGRRALLRIPPPEGRSVCLCWEHSKPKGLKGRGQGRALPVRTARAPRRGAPPLKAASALRGTHHTP